MPNFNRNHSMSRLVWASVCAASLSMTACSETPVKQTEAESCTTLKGLIADHSSQFEHYKKGTQTQGRRLSVWPAEKAFPNADKCQVWEWGTGKYSYVCEWKIGSDENQAISNYQEGTNIAGNCLDAAWTSETKTTSSGGKQTIFSAPNTNTVVSVRYYQEPNSVLTRWHNTVIIGDRNNLNPPSK